MSSMSSSAALLSSGSSVGYSLSAVAKMMAPSTTAAAQAVGTEAKALGSAVTGGLGSGRAHWAR
ncbi:hypothetical protein I552_3976 [Mycobacterium xenopi 3993]|nr:hypothetical protein I552_3976 [Mycobacterium xenopi 3993]